MNNTAAQTFEAHLFAEVAARVIDSGVEVTDDSIMAELTATLADRQAFLDRLLSSRPLRMEVTHHMADAIYAKYGRDAA
jgi:hypothetical protein